VKAMTEVKAKQTKIIPDGYEEVDSANFKRFEEIGDQVAGELIDKGTSEQYGFGLYTIINEEGEQIRFHGASQLDDLMLTIQIGDKILVKYIDIQKTPRGEMKLFKVYKGKGK
jgi:hypothetical protein